MTIIRSAGISAGCASCLVRYSDAALGQLINFRAHSLYAIDDLSTSGSMLARCSASGKRSASSAIFSVSRSIACLFSPVTCADKNQNGKQQRYRRLQDD